MSNTTAKLTLQMTDTGFEKVGTDLKTMAAEATKANAGLKTTASTVDQVSKSTTSLGSKITAAGKQFSGTITNVAALGSTVVNLSRQYQDLSDTQIRVDKTQLKMSKTAEAVRTAQEKVNKLTKAGVTNGVEYEKALLDVKQAQEASTLAVTMNGEALEDQQRAYENFFLGLAPTILTAGSSITSMLKEMGGEKGIGGLAAKLKGLGAGGIGGLSGLTAALGPLALAALAATTAFIAYDNAMKKVAESKKEEGLAKNAKNLAEELEHVKKSFDDLKLKPGTNIVDFFASMGPGGLQNTVLDWMEKAKTKTVELATETDALKTAREALNKALADPAMTDYQTAAGNTARLEAVAAEKEVKRLEGIEKTIPATQKLTTTQTAANEAMGKTNTLLDTMTQKTTGKSVFYTMAQTVDQLKASFIALNQEADRSQFMKLLSGGNPTAITTKTPVDPRIGFEHASIQQRYSDMTAYTKFRNDKELEIVAKAKTAADKLVADQKTAALEYESAWNKAYGAQLSGIDKIFAAYRQLHPGGTKDILDKHGKKIGTRTTEPGKLPIDLAEKAITQLESGLAQKLSSPASAKTFAENWITTAAAHMGGIAGKLLTPITTYIQQHAKEPPEKFIAGFTEFLGSLNLTDVFAKTFNPPWQAATLAAQQAEEKINASLGKIPPAVAKVKPPLDLMAKTLKNISVIKAAPTVTAKVVGQQPLNLMKQTIANIRSKTVTVTVKAQGAVGTLKGFSAGAHFAGGYSGTVRRPTMMLVGEGGREEDISITPKGSSGHSGSGGGGFSGTINVYVDGVLRPARYDMGARK